MMNLEMNSDKKKGEKKKRQSDMNAHTEESESAVI
jgi:hypothetical protein